MLTQYFISDSFFLSERFSFFDNEGEEKKDLKSLEETGCLAMKAVEKKMKCREQVIRRGKMKKKNRYLFESDLSSFLLN